MEEERQSNVEYKRFGVQGTTSEEVSRPIYRSIHYWGSSVY